MILDSSFVIDLLKNQPNAVKKAKELEPSRSSLAVTTISLFEIWKGVRKASDEKKSKVTELIASFKLYALDAEAAKTTAEIYGELVEAGQEIDSEDVMIAGIALVKNEPILTRNTKHFSRIKRLSVETY